MTTPAREAALAGSEPGTGSRGEGTQLSPSPAPVEAGAVIAQWQRRVQVWIDGDRVLPADGSSLLAALDRALEGLAGEDAVVTQAGIETFTRRVQILIDAGVLGAGDGQPQLEAAAVLVASLSSAGAADTQAQSRLGDTLRE